MVDLSSGYREYVMPSNSALHKKHLAIAISAALAGVSPMAYSACSPVGTTYTVETLSDVVDGFDGILSLREAITAANANPGCDTINFASSVTGTITFDLALSDRIDIADALNIVGPGSAQLTLMKEATGSLAMFNHCNGDLDISGLTIDGNNNSNNYNGIVSSEGMSSSGDCSSVITRDIGSFIADDIVIQNIADSGGSVPGEGLSIGDAENVSITNSHFTGNGGTGVRLSVPSSGTVAISDTVISGNSGLFSNGGGLMITQSSMSDVTISDSTFDNNSAEFEGGGIYINGIGGNLLIQNSTISNNTSASNGGGVHLDNPGNDFSMEILQSTISGNETVNNDIGGGLFMSGQNFNVGGTLAIRHSTITDNTAGLGGGASMNTYTSDIDLSHTIIADNTANTDPLYADVYIIESSSNTPPSAVEPSNNVIGSFSHIGVNPTTGNTLDVDDGSGTPLLSLGSAMLAVLADNGGTTLTHLPMDGSPVLETGDPAAVAGSGGVPALDQRGSSRIEFDFIDIGAVELVQPATSGGGGGSSMISPWLAGVLAAVMGLLRLRRR